MHRDSVHGRSRVGVPGTVALAVAAALAASGGAVAQETNGQGSDGQQLAQTAASSQLQEIVVTATRRSESIQSVPISVTAFSQAQMDIQGVKDVDDIARLSPSIQFFRGGGFGSDLGTQISIRGLGSTAGAATTGIYIDDTPIQVGATIASGNFAANAYPVLFDIQRVEVLNGPQGTLFGSGSEGGTVRFITPPPDLTHPSVYARSEASTTEYGAPSYEAGIAGGAPIIQDTVGFRASVWTRHDGGWVDKVDYYTGQVTNPNNNYRDAFSARLAFGWQPLAGLMITPSIYYQHIKANGTGTFQLHGDGLTGSNPPFFPGAPPPPPFPVFQQPYGDAANGDYVDIHHMNQWSNQRFALPALKIEWNFSNMALFSNTSYFERKQFGVTDFGWLEAGTWAGQLYPQDPTLVNPGNDSQGNRFLTQEVRLQSTNADSRLKWLVGAFYSDATTYADRNVYDPRLGELINQGPFGPCGTPAQCVAFIFGPVPLVDGLYTFVGNSQVNEKQKAVFGQLDYRIVGGLIATLGVRYAKIDTDWANYEGGPVNGVNFPGPGGEPETGSTSNHTVTPKYMLSYKTANTLTYLSATKGFRNGGVNAPLNNQQCQSDLAKLGLTKAPSSWDPDTVWSYELGTKLTMLDGRLIVDGAVFQYNWTNMINNQALSTCTLSFTTNIGTAQGRGFELAVQYRPLDPLVLSVSSGYSYLKATQTRTATTPEPTPSNPNPQPAIEIANGDTISGTLTINASAQYTFAVADKPSYFRVDYTYLGPPAVNFNPEDAGYNPYELFRTPGYSRTDMRLGMNFGNWDVSLFSDNIFNIQPILYETRTTVGFGAPSALLSAQTIRPRTSGITAIYRF